MSLQKKRNLILASTILFITILMAYFIYTHFISNNKIINPYFFSCEDKQIKYKGYFVPLSGNEIYQDTILEIDLIKEFQEGTLFSLKINQLDVIDSLDKISGGSDELGYFYVTEDIIYRIKLKYDDFYSVENEEKIIKELNSNRKKYLKQWDIVFAEAGTKDIVNKDGWHSYVAVEEDRRIFYYYNEYSSGTSYYEQIVWEENRGMVEYKSGRGSKLMHVELVLD